MRRTGARAIAVGVVLAACGGGGGSAGLEARIAAACDASSNMGAALCDCVGDEAGRDLAPKAQELLAAMLEQDDDRAEQLRGEVSVEEAMSAGTFMVRAPAACAARGVGSSPPVAETP